MADILAVGVTIFVSFFMIARWLALPTLLVLLGRPMFVDLTISVLVFVMFGGTLTGGAAAMLAAFMLSILLTFARRWLGYFDPKTKKLVRGHVNIDSRLEKYSN